MTTSIFCHFVTFNRLNNIIKNASQVGKGTGLPQYGVGKENTVQNKDNTGLSLTPAPLYAESPQELVRQQAKTSTLHNGETQEIILASSNNTV